MLSTSHPNNLQLARAPRLQNHVLARNPSLRPSIRVLRSVPALRAWRDPLVHQHRLVGLNHHVVVSIYLNPAQFGVAEDFASYPSTWDADVAAIARLDRELADDGANLGRVSAVFAPATADMYPEGFPARRSTQGQLRLHHPRRRAQPRLLWPKDAQQTVIIRRLVRDFLLPIDVLPQRLPRHPPPRLATVLSRALSAADAEYARGARQSSVILGAARHVLQTTLDQQMALAPSERATYLVDYISLADPDTMQELDVVDSEKGAILSGAVKMLEVEEPREGEDLGHSGGPPVRLIDNIRLQPVSTK
ncbi:unnamed protein product [Parascedosporium putredinis]|uniref:Pantoate--beta-alanine ligase n=1 Tax=Parascedosporium putredinis TaxID=1442378 RepID=A0A9P1GYA3_9PEZI|nr:unnamed protein product [Parascedosporium putredinis]CAI7991534.1 unnamed protein product [Parascedosporium putredinis]